MIQRHHIKGGRKESPAANKGKHCVAKKIHHAASGKRTCFRFVIIGQTESGISPSPQIADVGIQERSQKEGANALSGPKIGVKPHPKKKKNRHGHGNHQEARPSVWQDLRRERYLDATRGFNIFREGGRFGSACSYDDHGDEGLA